MVTYDIHFTVNGSGRSLTCQSVKVGNMFLQCFADTANNDSEKVAFIPFDAIEYIVHTETAVSVDETPDQEAHARALTN